MGGKTLCKLKGEKLARDPDAQRELILDPAYICEKCARVAHQDKHLCHATPLAGAAAEVSPSQKHKKDSKNKKQRKQSRKKDKKGKKGKKKQKA
jgi:hypothetical protein